MTCAPPAPGSKRPRTHVSPVPRPSSGVHDKTVRRRRAVLGLLVAFSLILLSAYFGESAGGGLHTVQSGFLDVLSPIQDGASRVLTPVRDLFSFVGGVFTASSDRDRLRKQVLAQQERIARLEARANTNAQAARILGMDRELGLSSYKQVTARVIYHSSNVWYSQVTIDAGTGDGVHANDAVIAGAGLARHRQPRRGELLRRDADNRQQLGCHRAGRLERRDRRARTRRRQPQHAAAQLRQQHHPGRTGRPACHRRHGRDARRVAVPAERADRVRHRRRSHEPFLGSARCTARGPEGARLRPGADTHPRGSRVAGSVSAA